MPNVTKLDIIDEFTVRITGTGFVMEGLEPVFNYTGILATSITVDSGT